MNTTDIVLSGARPTGAMHLGNYFGAIRNFVRMYEQYNCYFFIADYHSLTTHPPADTLSRHVKHLLATYLACGVDPSKTTLYIQSDVPQIPELYLIFNMLAYKGELEKIPTFKEKVRNQEKSGQSVNAGLLTYPVLMAVDILIHRATKVPVGKDQESHLEYCRNLANRFNYMTNSSFFPEPQAFNFGEELVKVPSLDGEGKMSKSENQNATLYLTDTDEVLRNKIKKAKTDSGPTTPNQPKSPAIQSLFDLMALLAPADMTAHYNDQYNHCQIRYGDFKKDLAECAVNFIAPIRQRIAELEADTDFLRQIVRQGGEKARESAHATLSEAKRLIGMRYF